MYFLTSVGGKWYIYFLKGVFMPKGFFERKPRFEMIGRRFSKLVVLEIDGKKDHSGFTYKCLCDCGNIREGILGDSLRRERTKSCGCDYPICTQGIGLTKEQYFEHTKKRLIQKRSIVNECWEWTGSKNNKGYGFISWGQGKEKKKTVVPRIAYTIWKGEIPEKLMVCHSCDNPICFNPDHLWLGTQKDNMQDMKLKKRGRRKNGL